MTHTSKELAQALENLAQVKGTLAYHRAKGLAKTADRLHNKKHLYFALCGDAIKIGVSAQPSDRVSTLQTGAPGPITILAVIEGAGNLESKCHRRLEHLHLHGEWYRHTLEVDALIMELSSDE